MFPQAIGNAATWDAPLIHAIGEVVSTEARAKVQRRHRATTITTATTASPSGRPTSTSFAIPAGDAARKPTAKTPSSPPASAPPSSKAFRATIRTQILPRHRHAQALRRPQRPEIHAPRSRRRPHPARSLGHLPARLPRHHHRRPRRLHHVRLQPHRQSPRLRQQNAPRRHPPRRLALPGLRHLRLRRHRRLLRSPTAITTPPTTQPAQPPASSPAPTLDCGTEYLKLTDAVHKGLLTEAQLDVSVKRLFTARMKLGMFDPPQQVPFSSIPYSVVDSPEHAEPRAPRRTRIDGPAQERQPLPPARSREASDHRRHRPARRLRASASKATTTPSRCTPSSPSTASSRNSATTTSSTPQGSPYIMGGEVPVPRTMLRTASDSTRRRPARRILRPPRLRRRPRP